MKNTFGVAGLVLGALFAIGAVAASASSEAAGAGDRPAMMGGDAGPGPETPRIIPKAPGQKPAPSLRSDAGPPGAKAVP